MIRHCPNWVKDEWKPGLSVVFLSNLAIAQPHFLCGWYLRPCLVHSKSTKSDKPTISKNLKSLFRSQRTLNTVNGAVVHLEAKAPPGSRRTFSHQQEHRHTCKAPSWFTVMLHVEICWNWDNTRHVTSSDCRNSSNFPNWAQVRVVGSEETSFYINDTTANEKRKWVTWGGH